MRNREQKGGEKTRPAHLPIVAGVHCSGGGGVAGAGVGFLPARLLDLHDGLHHFRLDCLSAVVVHRLCRDEAHGERLRETQQISICGRVELRSGIHQQPAARLHQISNDTKVVRTPPPTNSLLAS